MLLLLAMTSKRPKGQALAEYLLTLTVLVLVAYAGVQAWRQALNDAEIRQATTMSLPSP